MSRQKKGRQQIAAGHRMIGSTESELAALTSLSIGELKAAWRKYFDRDSPGVRSRHLLLRLFAWQMQVEALGGLDASTERKLRDIAKALERDGMYEPKIRHDLSPGVVLTREWKGEIHKVTATADGFDFRGKRYTSLSDIARTITGTRWSGPRFFGLEQRNKPVSRKAIS